MSHQLHEILRVACDLLTGVWSEPTPVRLLGVGADRLVGTDGGVQLDLFGTTRWEDAERVADQVRAQFGDVALTRAALLGGTARSTAPSRDDLGDVGPISE